MIVNAKKIGTKIIGGLLVKNEADRWLNEFLARYSTLCDEIIILDDGSSDQTPVICSKFGTVYLSRESYWETREWMQRETLFNLCLEKSNHNNWIIILDADEIINNPYKLRKYLKSLSTEYTGFGLALYDMWNEDHYRSDEHWTAHKRIWQMATRKKDKNYTWNKTSLHCGRLPIQTSNDTISYNNDFYIKHMGWSTEKDRINKYNRYMEIDGDGKYGWLDQYKSILDEHPHLVKLEDKNNE